MQKAMKSNLTAMRKFRRKEDITGAELAVLLGGGGVCDQSENTRCGVWRFLLIRGLRHGRCVSQASKENPQITTKKHSTTQATEATAIAVRVLEWDKGCSQALPPFAWCNNGLRSPFSSSPSPTNCAGGVGVMM